MKKLSEIITGRGGRPKPEMPRLLPYTVLDHLKNRDAQLTQSDVESLFRNGFQNLGFYLAMKLADGQELVQGRMLARLGAHNFDFSQLSMDEVAEAFKDKEDTPIKGAKLAQVSRYGFEHWVDRIGQKLTQVRATRPDLPIFIMANSTYVGLEPIAQQTIGEGQPLGILLPNNFSRPERPVGFMLTPSLEGVSVEFLPHDFPRPQEAILFDDVLNSGTKMKQAIDFWTNHHHDENPPYFVTASVSNRI